MQAGELLLRALLGEGCRRQSKRAEPEQGNRQRQRPPNAYALRADAPLSIVHGTSICPDDSLAGSSTSGFVE
jgi:hypothetical protein